MKPNMHNHVLGSSSFPDIIKPQDLLQSIVKNHWQRQLKQAAVPVASILLSKQQSAELRPAAHIPSFGWHML